MIAPGTATALALLAFAGPGDALADEDPCTSHQPEAGVPVRAHLGPADFGMIPEACPASSLTLDAGGVIAVDRENYYGSILVAGSLRGRLTLPRGPWVSIYVPGAEYRFVANASLQPSSFDVGAGAVGAHFPVRLHRSVQIAPYARVLLPTESIFNNATRTGWELGSALVWDAHRMVEVVGGVTLPLFVTFVGPEAKPRLMPAATADVGFRPARWFTLAGGLALRLAADEDDTLEALDARGALRFYPWRGLLVELSGAFPVAGRDRTDAAAFLSLGWIFTHDRTVAAMK